MYIALDQDEEQRQARYRDLFNGQIDEQNLASIREATNKAWVLGSDYFKQKIEAQLNRRADKLTKGGDRKSDKFRQNKKFNQV